MDEKWAFVGKKQKRCDDQNPADARLGDCWDHVALDPAHRLVLSVVPGKRTAENVRTLVQDSKGYPIPRFLQCFRATLTRIPREAVITSCVYSTSGRAVVTTRSE